MTRLISEVPIDPLTATSGFEITRVGGGPRQRFHLTDIAGIDCLLPLMSPISMFMLTAVSRQNLSEAVGHAAQGYGDFLHVGDAG